MLVSAPDRAVTVEVWSDVVCPWCYIGKRRLERALAQFEHADEVEVVWRSFQLDPTFPAGVRQPVPQMLAEKIGGTLEQVRQMNARVTALAAEERSSWSAGAPLLRMFRPGCCSAA